MDAGTELTRRVREWVARPAGQGLGPAEDAVVRSLICAADEADLSLLLREFFDCEPVAMAVHDAFLERGAMWPRGLREQLAEALLFHGRDDDAVPILRTLAQESEGGS